MNNSCNVGPDGSCCCFLFLGSQRSEQQMDCRKSVVTAGSATVYSSDQAKKSMLPTENMLYRGAAHTQQEHLCTVLCNPAQIACNGPVEMKCSTYGENSDDTVCDCAILQDARLNYLLALGDKITSPFQVSRHLKELNKHLADTRIGAVSRWQHLFHIAWDNARHAGSGGQRKMTALITEQYRYNYCADNWSMRSSNRNMCILMANEREAWPGSTRSVVSVVSNLYQSVYD